MELDLSIFDSLQRSNANLQHYIDQRLIAASSLSSSQFRILKVIAQHPGIEQKAIAIHLLQSEAATSRMIKQLKKQDLIIINKDEADGRRRHIILSLQGGKVMQLAEAKLQELQLELLRNFSPSETDALRRLLEKIQLSLI